MMAEVQEDPLFVGIRLMLTVCKNHGGEWTHYAPDPEHVSFYRTDEVSGEFIRSNEWVSNYHPSVMRKEFEDWAMHAMAPNSYQQHWSNVVNDLREQKETKVEKDVDAAEPPTHPDQEVRATALNLALQRTAASSSEETVQAAQQFYEFLTGQSQETSQDEKNAKYFHDGWLAAIREVEVNLVEAVLSRLNGFLDEQLKRSNA